MENLHTFYQFTLLSLYLCRSPKSYTLGFSFIFNFKLNLELLSFKFWCDVMDLFFSSLFYGIADLYSIYDDLAGIVELCSQISLFSRKSCQVVDFAALFNIYPVFMVKILNLWEYLLYMMEQELELKSSCFKSRLKNVPTNCFINKIKMKQKPPFIYDLCISLRMT